MTKAVPQAPARMPRTMSVRNDQRPRGRDASTAMTPPAQKIAAARRGSNSIALANDTRIESARFAPLGSLFGGRSKRSWPLFSAVLIDGWRFRLAQESRQTIQQSAARLAKRSEPGDCIF